MWKVKQKMKQTVKLQTLQTWNLIFWSHEV